ncbi:hypothetical protein T439DRAFT_320223 [Meredithblackwellia eburnea MCA 4105]
MPPPGLTDLPAKLNVSGVGAYVDEAALLVVRVVLPELLDEEELDEEEEEEEDVPPEPRAAKPTAAGEVNLKAE